VIGPAPVKYIKYQGGDSRGSTNNLRDLRGGIQPRRRRHAAMVRIAQAVGGFFRRAYLNPQAP
jgi:hypothetical protein